MSKVVHWPGIAVEFSVKEYEYLQRSSRRRFARRTQGTEMLKRLRVLLTFDLAEVECELERRQKEGP